MNEILPFATTWMDQEDFMLTKKEKDMYHTISLICGIWKTKQIKITNQSRVLDTENKQLPEERGIGNEIN